MHSAQHVDEAEEQHYEKGIWCRRTMFQLCVRLYGSGAASTATPASSSRCTVPSVLPSSITCIVSKACEVLRLGDPHRHPVCQSVHMDSNHS